MKIGEKIDELNREITNKPTTADEGGTQPATGGGGTNPTRTSAGAGVSGNEKEEIIM